MRELLLGVAPAVLAGVRSVLGPTHCDVEDVAQEALLAFRDGLQRYRGEAPLALFARGFAVRLALSARRRIARRRHLLFDWQTSEGGASALAYGATEAALETDAKHHLGATISPDEHWLKQQRLQAVRDLLDTLPLEQAEAVALRFIFEHELADVARLTETPVNTVRSRLRLAKESLRRQLLGDASLLELFALRAATKTPPRRTNKGAQNAEVPFEQTAEVDDESD